MKVLECVFTAAAYVTLKKVLEVVMEGTERARFSFRPHSDTPVVVQTADSLWTCKTRVGFKRHSFERFRVTAPVELTVDIKVMHDFLRACKQRRRIRLTLDMEALTEAAAVAAVFTPDPKTDARQQLTLSDVGDTLTPVTLYHCPDDAPQFDDTTYTAWPCFTISSQELTNITLDLAVGGTEMSIRMHMNRDIVMFSEFDTGYIEHYGFHGDNSVFSVVKAPDTTITSGRYIVKFLKLVSALAVLTSHVQLYVQAGGDLVIELGAHEHIQCACVIHPYKGPRGVAVPDEYLSFALRLT